MRPIPALNYKKELAPKVESGAKRQTIRSYRKDGRDPQKGDTLHHYTGQRTKACRKLLESICTGTKPIFIDYGRVIVGTEKLTIAESQSFAIADGFDNYEDFQAFFAKDGLPFYGLLVAWSKGD